MTGFRHPSSPLSRAIRPRAVMRRRMHFAIFCVATCCIAAAATSARAATPEWFDAPHDYVVLDQDIRAALTEFGRNLGLAVVLSEAVRGRVRGPVAAENAGEFLQTLTEANGLIWYFDGAVLHISAASEYATRLIPSGRLNAAAVTRQMQDLGLFDDRFDVRGARDAGVLSVSGPPAYLRMVEQFVAGLQPAPTVIGDDPRVVVYRGRGGRGDLSVATIGATDPSISQPTR